MVQRIRLTALREHRLGKGWNLETLKATSKVPWAATCRADDGEPITVTSARKIASAMDLPVTLLAGQQKLFIEDIKGGISPGCHCALTQWGGPDSCDWAKALHQECARQIAVVIANGVTLGKLQSHCGCSCHALNSEDAGKEYLPPLLREIPRPRF